MANNQTQQGGQAKKSFSLLGKQQKKPQEQTFSPALMSKIKELNTRMALLEETLNRVNERMKLVENQFVKEKEKTDVEVKTNIQEIRDINKKMEDLRDTIDLIISDIKGTARKEDTEVMKKYIQMWEPLNFVTRKEFIEKIEELKEEMNK